MEEGCLLWGIRVVVPQRLRAKLLDELHKDHPGVVRMKSVARSYMWWPGLDKDIQNLVKTCQACQATKGAPPVAPLHPWVWPSRPWQRLQLDFAGPFQGSMFLIGVESAKKALISSQVLVHYDPALPIRLIGDASAYGVGAVIAHVLPDGSEHPVAFASRTLTKSERNYAQVEKEALSLIFGVRHFHTYLYGRSFTIVTDHKPLTAILGPKNGIPPLAAARLQRWAWILSAYQYNIEFRPTGEHGNADGLSRLPIPGTVPQDVDADPQVFNVSQMQSLPVNVRQLRAATS